MVKVNIHVSNLNRLLKKVKSECSVNFICADNKMLLITTNKITVILDLNIIKKYIKDLSEVNYNDIESPKLPQSKLYLKILSISYFVKDTNLSILFDIIKSIHKSIYIFNNITLTSHSHIIKASPKSDMAVTWVDIWDFQSGANIKMLINRCFNIRSHIVTIHRTNIKLGVFQCKN